MNTVLNNMTKCTGCTLCSELCPKHCIIMKEEFDGFKYPKINQELCINCGICRKNCPAENPRESVEPKGVFAFRHSDKTSVEKSASGGAASCFGEYCLNSGGFYTGVKLTDELCAVHNLCSSREELDEYRGSKYVQSDMNGIFKKIEDKLKLGALVFVTGTPCQIAAVKTYLKKDYNNLILCDLICHGFPSPKIFNAYISQIERDNGKTVEKFYFRDKTNGWIKSNIRAIYSDGSEEIITRDKSDFFKLFNMTLRKSCYACRFRGFRSGADITLGDFWGIEQKSKLFSDDLGCSIVITNTQKGKEFFNKIKDKEIVLESDISFAIATHPKLIKSISYPRSRKLFFKDFNKFGLKKVAKLYTNNNIFLRARKTIKLFFRENRND